MNERRSKMKEKLHEKAMETLQAVVPILLIVLTLCFTIAPMEPGILLAFLVGAVLLIVGMIGFTFGVDLAMSPIGESVGTCMTQTRKLWLMVLLTFILGFIVTISEPDLQVLAEQVPSIPNMILVLSVAFGVGIFLVAALLRMLFGITLAHMLIVLYLIITVVRNIIEPKIVGGQIGLHPVVTLASMFVGVQLLGAVGLFGFPIGLSLLRYLNDTGVIRIFRKPEAGQ